MKLQGQANQMEHADDLQLVYRFQSKPNHGELHDQTGQQDEIVARDLPRRQRMG